MTIDRVDANGDVFGFHVVVERAKQLASHKYRAEKLPLRGDFATLKYDNYRDIRFDTKQPVLKPDVSDFAMDLLAPGWLFDQPVAINLVANGSVESLHYRNDWFDFGPLAAAPTNPQELTFSGFRLRYPINRPDVMDEFVVFQGASYFRAVARDQLYGLSARALAVDTATERGEEFPRFTEFWIEQPTEKSTSMVVHALLDSPSMTGAVRFDISPGADTRMGVQTVLFPRRDVEVVGIAPLTSMFLFNNLNRERFDDYRDAVHDSSGLQIIDGTGARLWRSLANPRTLQVSSFVDDNPLGFGLIQRPRAFESYEDAEAFYERRPSAWVQPIGDWGKGAVQLVEIPTELETNDNVVAYWKPQATLEKGEEYRYDYRLHWTDQAPDEAALLRVKDVRMGTRMKSRDVYEVIVDFVAPHGDIDPSTVPQLEVGAGKVSDLNGRALIAAERYRVQFNFRPDEVQSSEWQLKLLVDGRAISETWMYRWTS